MSVQNVYSLEIFKCFNSIYLFHIAQIFRVRVHVATVIHTRTETERERESDDDDEEGEAKKKKLMYTHKRSAYVWLPFNDTPQREIIRNEEARKNLPCDAIYILQN